MVDAALIKECSDPGLKPATVEQFIERVGAPDPLAVTVRSGNRVVLVPRPKTAEEALALIRDNLGRNTVRVGITQYPAGLGIVEAGELKPDLVDACKNIRMGTALFAKVYRIVTKWYGNPTERQVLPQVFDDAIIAWQTGYFEGTAVFSAADPAGVKLTEASRERQAGQPFDDADRRPDSEGAVDGSRTNPDIETNANRAGIRVDLSGIGR
ncbi:TraH family protein (plasmid) [Agrobacterium sp. rho-13.3]|uniref:TraH family protein n=1 Tax=Agrobacterium sp. rho-13.3 TaxID=3072980 RepID=UPI002A13970E|nr:TraH family protein [Agrobacterium sp. rho-13.3]MDX8310127.1 TraH family protein [Agrobacterium sp. rho-13.3]